MVRTETDHPLFCPWHNMGSSKNRTYSVHGHGYFKAETHFLIHWNRETHFSDKAIILHISNSGEFSTRAQRGFDLAANSAAIGFDSMELGWFFFPCIVWLSEGPTSHILPGNLLSAERRHRAVTLREVCQRRHSGLAEVPTTSNWWQAIAIDSHS